MEKSSTKALTSCSLCGTNCYIEATLENGKIVSVSPAEGYVHAKGSPCVKGAALKQFVHHPDRLTHPLKLSGPKGSGQYVTVSWDEAIKDIAARLLAIKEESGPQSTIFYGGHPKWYRKTLSYLASAYGSPNFATESSTCHSAMTMAWKLNYGVWMMPDMKNCDTLLVWSSNSAYSTNGMFKGVAGVEKRGGKVILVDPRITPVAGHACLHLRPVPGTDGALALAIAHVIIEEGLEDKDFLEKNAYGYEEYKAYVAGFTPEIVQEITSVPKEQIIEAAHIIAGGKTAFLTSSCSVVHCTNGVQNLRAALLLLALTGSIGSEGSNKPDGPKPFLDNFHHDLPLRPDSVCTFNQGQFPIWDELVNDEVQCINMADAILAGKPYPIRALVGFGFNVGMWPQPDKIVDALKKLEFTVISELFMNEACGYADYILPACVAQERDRVELGSDGTLMWIPKIVDPEDKLPDTEIMIRLAKAMNLTGDFISCDDYHGWLNRTMKTTGVTLDELLEHPEGMPVRIKKPAGEFDPSGNLNTPSGKIEFSSVILEKYPQIMSVPAYTDWRESIDMTEFPMILVAGARKPQFFHSRTFRVGMLSGLEPHTVINIHPQDAEALGLSEGGRVKLSTPAGSMRYTVQLDTGIKEGTVYVYHDDADQNINKLIPNGITDPLSGFPIFRSYICRLEKID